MPAERRPIAVSLDIPEPNRLIEGSARQGPSVRTPSYRFYPIGMSDQRLEEVSSGDLPELDGRISPPTGHYVAIGGIGETRDIARMRARPEQSATLHIPQFDHPIITPAGQAKSIWAEAQERDNICVGLPDPVQRLVSPHPHFPSPVACSPVLPIVTDRYGPDGTKRLSKDTIQEPGPGQRCVLHLGLLQMRTTQQEMRQVETTQMPPLLVQQR